MKPAARYTLAGVLLALAAWHFASTGPAPAPGPDTPAALDLRGKFVGPTAAADAATFAALTLELADVLEHDGTLEHPHLTTATAFDDLRQRARELRMRGQSLGDRHPRARDAVAAYLEKAVGTSGGPVTPEARASWVAAYRTIGEAAANAAR